MNERIKELYKQAGFDSMGIWKIIGIHEYHEKFAELIINECVEIIKDKSHYYCQTGYPMIGGSMAEGAVLIRKHFGVE